MTPSCRPGQSAFGCVHQEYWRCLSACRVGDMERPLSPRPPSRVVAAVCPNGSFPFVSITGHGRGCIDKLAVWSGGVKIK